MLSGKDIYIDKEGNIHLNGDVYKLASQTEIDAVKDDIDDLGDTIGDITQTGITGASVAAQLGELEGKTLKVVNVSATMTVSTADPDAIGGYRSVAQTSKPLSTFTGYPTGKVVVADSLHAYGANAATAAVVNVINGVVYLNAAKVGDYTVEGVVFYHD